MYSDYYSFRDTWHNEYSDRSLSLSVADANVVERAIAEKAKNRADIPLWSWFYVSDKTFKLHGGSH